MITTYDCYKEGNSWSSEAGVRSQAGHSSHCAVKLPRILQRSIA
jgi:hypothetical protein